MSDPDPKAIELYRKEFYEKYLVPLEDEFRDRCILSVCIGFFIGKGYSYDESYEISTYIRYETNLG
jgi:hypothetical protein